MRARTIVSSRARCRLRSAYADSGASCHSARSSAVAWRFTSASDSARSYWRQRQSATAAEGRRSSRGGKTLPRCRDTDRQRSACSRN